MQCSLRSPGNHPRLFSIILSAVVLGCLLLTSSELLCAQEKTSQKLEPFQLDLVPKEAIAVAAFRPAQILGEPALKPIRKLLLKDLERNPNIGFLGLMPTDVKSVTVIYFLLDQGEASRSPIKTVFLFETTNKLDQTKIKQKFWKSELTESTYQGKKLLTKGSGSEETLLFLSDHSFLFSDKAGALKKVIDQMHNRNAPVWTKWLAEVSTASFAAGINTQTLRDRLGEAFIQPITQRIPAWPMIAPIWNNVEITTLGITVQNDFSLKLIFDQKNNTEQVKQALDGLLLVGQNLVRQLSASLKQRNPPLPPEEKSYLKQFEQIVSDTKVTQDETRVIFSTAMSQDLLSQMMARTIPAITQAREAARHSVSKNNIKQIMLALHNYHERHHHFPPAVVLGPDGKTPHSWRVELLPYLDQQELYDKYRMNEPWDSEHNLEIAKTVVPVFQNPSFKKPANSSYFVVVGDGTAFGNKQGTSFKDITDGTSNTIAIVEAERDIPWTKPEDISYDGKKLPQFGGFHIGGYHVGMCDGAVRFISARIDKETLKFLLLMADGEVLN